MFAPNTVNSVAVPEGAVVGVNEVITGSVGRGVTVGVVVVVVDGGVTEAVGVGVVVLVGVRVTVVVPPPPQAASVEDKTNAVVISRKVVKFGLEFLCIDITFWSAQFTWNQLQLTLPPLPPFRRGFGPLIGALNSCQALRQQSHGPRHTCVRDPDTGPCMSQGVSTG